MVRFSILLVDAVINARQANDSTRTSGLEGLVLSLKEALPQPWLVVRRIFLYTSTKQVLLVLLTFNGVYFFQILLKRAQLLQTLAKL